MPHDYIPKPDSSFNTWQQNYVNYAVANALALGLTPVEITTLQGEQLQWITAYNNHIVAQNTARGAQATKDDERDELEAIIRTLTKKIQARTETTNMQRESLGITIPDTTRTPIPPELVLTTPPPMIEIRCTAPKTVTINWYPSSVGGSSDAIPQGLDGVAIYYAVKTDGEPLEFKFLAMDTNTPYIHNVENAETVTLVYKAQWFDKRKRLGPFSAEVRVAVTS